MNDVLDHSDRKHEEAHRRLMRTLAPGDSGAALARYEARRRLLPDRGTPTAASLA
jgi:hypothetical protein